MTRLILLSILLFVTTPAWAAVTWDTTTARNNPTADQADSFSHTIGTGTNVYVGVCVSTRGASLVDVTEVTIDGEVANHRETQNSSSTVQLEYWDRVLGSTNGAVTITVATDAADRFNTNAFSLFGVDQSSPVGTDNGSAAGTGTSVSVDVASQVGGLVVSCLAISDEGTTLVEGANQTERWDTDNSGTNDTMEEGTTEPGAPTVTMSVSWTTTAINVFIAEPIQAAPTGRGGGMPLLLD